MSSYDYDMIIIGGGPAGLTAGLYAGRGRFKTLLLEKLITGGQVMTTDHVDNYPGFPEGVAGYELSQRMRDQAERFGAEIRSTEVLGLKPGNPYHTVVLEGGEEVVGRTVIIASGAQPRRVGVPGEAEYTGKGVGYCATCDGALYRDETIAVVGGGDTALQDAVFLTRFAAKVYLIHRRDQFRGARLYQEKVLANDKIDIIYDTVVQEILGDKNVSGLRLKNVKTGVESSLEVTGVFVFVGIQPITGWLEPGLLDQDEFGFIRTNEEMATNVPGIYAAGDVRAKLLRQISTAVGDGATAAFAAEKYLEEQH
ncbi:MAG: thioredoxin-disulfide reductase [Deltaproteobacteria bacterium]|nr:thioredoxin-disulfide reductase [Deltaproteobacteria bacterium]